MKILKIISVLSIALLWAGGPLSAAAEDGLTEFGSEKAGNADGSIPPYTGGGVKSIPADFKAGSGRYPDPFKDEKPLYSIDAKNLAQYTQLLAPGTQALFQRFPDYRVDVYPSHRTMAYPDWVLKNTLNNVGKAKLIGDKEGDGLEGAYGGIPFPTPKNGLEVMWNQAMRYQGPRTDMRFSSFLIDRSGRATLVGDQETSLMFSYYDPKASSMDMWNYMVGLTNYFGPPAQVGQLFLQKYTINNSVKDDTTWVYTPGQRRVRVAPELKYDTPASSIGGVVTFDELGGFNGRKDRFDFKVLGKKEMLVPYNNYRAFFEEGLIKPQHENPDLMRWEKHRVWVVEATLKPGQRHIYSKRVYYIDEDSWIITLYEAYDQSNQLYRVMNTLNMFMYDKPRIGQPSQIIYDLTKGTWAITAYLADPRASMIPYDDMPNLTRFTPETLAGNGVR
ncbi:DUF1329 domain-containing protein [Pseudomonas corrugata]|uniref:DUF1329 domain-containing protein n=1 Tax=Pseudomonas corrugata TaxID=47879 RepID=UPI001586176A|nr:DUF1329 domain-containing protein [Pseudomonas corrugata]MCI0997646.1 DUF1329 domain-containing protein [Pseudomonas corrugata]NUT64693.1 DUF1329 domain-containing protein [Pseudomonas corrugata]